MNNSVICFLEGDTEVLCEIGGVNETFHHEELLKPTSGKFWMFLLVYIFLVLFAGNV